MDISIRIVYYNIIFLQNFHQPFKAFSLLVLQLNRAMDIPYNQNILANILQIHLLFALILLTLLITLLFFLFYLFLLLIPLFLAQILNKFVLQLLRHLQILLLLRVEIVYHDIQVNDLQNILRDLKPI